VLEFVTNMRRNSITSYLMICIAQKKILNFRSCEIVFLTVLYNLVKIDHACSIK